MPGANLAHPLLLLQTQGENSMSNGDSISPHAKAQGNTSVVPVLQRLMEEEVRELAQDDTHGVCVEKGCTESS